MWSRHIPKQKRVTKLTNWKIETQFHDSILKILRFFLLILMKFMKSYHEKDYYARDDGYVPSIGTEIVVKGFQTTVHENLIPWVPRVSQASLKGSYTMWIWNSLTGVSLKYWKCKLIFTLHISNQGSDQGFESVSSMSLEQVGWLWHFWPLGKLFRFPRSNRSTRRLRNNHTAKTGES